MLNSIKGLKKNKCCNDDDIYEGMFILYIFFYLMKILNIQNYCCYFGFGFWVLISF